MAVGGSGAGVRVQGSGRAYAAVIGVTVGMLIGGLAVPLAFGQVPNSTSNASAGASSGPISLGSQPSSSTLPGTTSQPGGIPSNGKLPTGGLPTGGALPTGSPLTGGPGSTRSSSLPGGGSVRGGRLTASDVGVTPTTVKVGVVLLDVQALQPLGFTQPHYSPSEQQQQWQVFFNQTNKAGGLAGRQIVPDYVTWNALDTSGSSSDGAVCTKLAQDDRVFAVVGMINSTIGTCLTGQYGIPVIGDGEHLQAAYAAGHYLLVSPNASLERMGADWGDFAARSGLLRGRTLGTVTTTTPTEARPTQYLQSALRADGYSVKYAAVFSGDQSSFESQLPIEIQKMRAAGVNTVFLSMNFVTSLQFVQSANSQGWTPQYLVSDIGAMTAEGLVNDMPSSYNGTIAWTQSRQNGVETAEDHRCRTSFNAATGNSYKAGDDSDVTYLICWMSDVLRISADRVGGNLTRVGMARAFQQLGTPGLGFVLPGSFSAGKTDFSDYWRPERYATSCKCYKAAGGAARGRY